MTRRVLAALDIGSTKVACVVGRLVDPGEAPAWSRALEEGVEILGHGVASYPLGGWPPDSSCMTEAIEQALAETRVSDVPDRVSVTLTHPQMAAARVMTHIDLADEPVAIRARDLHRIRGQAVAQALGIDREAVLLEAIGFNGNGFDGVRDPRGLVATRLQGTFHLVSMPMNVRRLVTQALERLGLEVDQLVYSLHALAVSCISRASGSTADGTQESLGSEGGRFLLVDVGGACTDVALVRHGHVVQSATIPWGGRHVIEAVAKTCRVTLDQALATSLEGLASSKPTVRQVIETELRALREPIHRLLQDGPLPEQAVVTGRGALMDGLVEWVETMTGVPAMLGRSGRTKDVGEVSRQIALSPSMGALELAARAHRRTMLGRTVVSSRLLDRVLDRTKRILVEYF